MLHENLWRANLDLARACLAHPFVRGLGDGSLDPQAFRGYIAQDAFFLRSFAKAYALALARSDNLETIFLFHNLIGGVSEELRIHRGYAAELGIDLERVAPNPACGAYTDFLLHTAWHGSLAETVAAMTPCMRLYAYLGAELAARSVPSRSRLADRWIAAYSSREFAELANRLERLLDRVGADTRQVRDCYRYAMQRELDFFSDALEQKV